MDKVIWTKPKIWTKNNGTKVIWINIAWEQILCGLNKFRQKTFGQKELGQVGYGLKCFAFFDLIFIHCVTSLTEADTVYKKYLSERLWDIILMAKFMLDKDISDKPILEKMILDEVLFSF